MGDEKGGGAHSHAGDTLVGEIENNKMDTMSNGDMYLGENCQEGKLSKFLSVFSEQPMERAECSRLREQQVQRP